MNIGPEAVFQSFILITSPAALHARNSGHWDDVHDRLWEALPCRKHPRVCGAAERLDRNAGDERENLRLDAPRTPGVIC
jgi:hypothetical protein